MTVEGARSQRARPRGNDYCSSRFHIELRYVFVCSPLFGESVIKLDTFQLLRGFRPAEKETLKGQPLPPQTPGIRNETSCECFASLRALTADSGPNAKLSAAPAPRPIAPFQTLQVSRRALNWTRQLRNLRGRRVAQRIDERCRVVFPSVFFIFNVAYWSFYILLN